MIRFAVIGTNWITRQFVDATHETGKYKLIAIYSRSFEQAQTFTNDYPVEHLFTSLEAMTRSGAIDAVYIANPNFLHFPQAELFSQHKKHVTCEKPPASSPAQAETTITCARQNQVVLFEAFKTAYLPNFLLLQQSLPEVGKIGGAFINYCQCSSRYQRYLDGESPNTFNPAFSSGPIMDIGFYCLVSAVALWGEPQSTQASTSLLENGVGAHGVVVLNYSDFGVTLQHSKVSDSVLTNEIQDKSGSLVIEHISECQEVCFMPRGGKTQDLMTPQHINTMLYKAETFAHLVESGEVDHPALVVNRTTTKLQVEIRRQTDTVFPADEAEAPLTA